MTRALVQKHICITSAGPRAKNTRETVTYFAEYFPRDLVITNAKASQMRAS